MMLLATILFALFALLFYGEEVPWAHNLSYFCAFGCACSFALFTFL